MSDKNVCPVHGTTNANDAHNYSAKKAVKLGHPEMTVDSDCTCDVGCTGPAKEGKGNTPVGPGAETKKPGPADDCKQSVFHLYAGGSNFLNRPFFLGGKNDKK